MTEMWGRRERWIKHYSSSHSILLVGEGDFSFSYCLATAFGSATNIVATSLDTYDRLMEKYKKAYANLAVLEILGATCLHGVDATRMKIIPYLQSQKFDRIIYNFPHAGFHGKEINPDIILLHRNLVRGFLTNASTMLRPGGEIHVNHKTTAPFASWRIEDLAAECSLLYVGQDDFRIEDYPGYHNKRGSGSRPDEPFPLGECKTFRFGIYHRGGRNSDPLLEFSVRRQPRHNDCNLSDGRRVLQADGRHNGWNWSDGRRVLQADSRHNDYNLSDGRRALQADGLDECRWIFGRYLDDVERAFGRSTSYDDIFRSVNEALRVGYETYMGSGERRRPASGYIDILEGLLSLSYLRSEKLRQRLPRHDRPPRTM